MSVHNVALSGEQIMAFLRLAEVVNDARRKSSEGLLPDYRQFEPGDVYKITQGALQLVVVFETGGGQLNLGFTAERVKGGLSPAPNSEVRVSSSREQQVIESSSGWVLGAPHPDDPHERQS